MRVDGELLRAQVEQLTGAPAAPQPTGRIIADVTTPTAALPKFFDGTSWRTLGYASTTTATMVTQNSGKACTVDWSTGLVQQVKLTAETVISFVNPQANQIHILIITPPSVTAGVVPTLYGYALNMPDQDSRRTAYQGQLLQYPRPNTNIIYSWLYEAGIKPAVTTISGTAATETRTGVATTALDISADANYLLLGSGTSPFTNGYLLYDSMTTEFGTPTGFLNVVASTAAAGAATAVKYTNDGRVAFVLSGTSPYLQGYFVDRGKPTSSAITAGTGPTGAAWSVDMHPSNAAVAVGHSTTPFLSVYTFTGSALTARYANPSTLPAGNGAGVAFSPMGDFIAMAVSATPFIQCYPFNINTSPSLSAICAAPSTLPTGSANTGVGGIVIAWRPQGDFIAMATSVSPYLYLVPFNRTTGAFGVAITTPTLAGNMNTVAWTPDGQFLIVGGSVSPYLYVYDFSNLTSLVAVSFDATLVSVTVNAVKVHPSGEHMIVSLNASPYLITIKLPQKIRNYVKLVD